MAAPPEVPGVEHEWVRAGEVTLHVARAGPRDAPAVVLLHGWPQHWYMWRRVIPLLDRDFQLLAVDLRGFGWSDAPAGDYAKETLAADVVALLEALDLRDVVLVGHDWGGWVGFLTCLRAPERLKGYLALAIPAPWAPMRMPLRERWRFLYQPVVATPGLGSLVQRHLLTRAVFASDRIWSDADREAFAAPFREPARAKAASAVYRTFLLREINRRPEGDMRVPATLLVGRRDPVVTPALVAGSDGRGDVRIEEVDATHWIAEELPETVAEHVRALAVRPPE